MCQGALRNNKGGSGAKELTLNKEDADPPAPSAGPEEGKGSTGGFREIVLELSSSPESHRARAQVEALATGLLCWQSTAQPGHCQHQTLSAEAAHPSPMGWPLLSTHLLSPYRGCPIPLLSADHGVGSCPPQHKDQTQDFPNDQTTATAGKPESSVSGLPNVFAELHLGGKMLAQAAKQDRYWETTQWLLPLA